MDHRWPGNVRELEHLVERMVLGERVRSLWKNCLDLIGQQSSAALTFQGEIRNHPRHTVALCDLGTGNVGRQRMLTAEKLDVDIKTLARLLKTEPERNENEAWKDRFD